METREGKELFDLWTKLGSSSEPLWGAEEEVRNEGEGEEQKVSEEKEPTTVPVLAPQEAVKEKFDNLVNLFPEKFRSASLEESIRKIVQSYQELESKFTKVSQELAEATKLLKTLSEGNKTQPVAPQTGGELDVDIDIKPEEFWANPVDALKRAIAQAAKQFSERMNPLGLAQTAAQVAMAQMAINQLRAQDPETFDKIKDDLVQVLREKPYLDNVEGLRIAYEEAKQRYRARQEEMKKQLIDENLINSLKDTLVKEIVQKLQMPQREFGGIPLGATGGGAQQVEISKPKEKAPEEQFKELFLSTLVSSPLLTGGWERK